MAALTKTYMDMLYEICFVAMLHMYTYIHASMSRENPVWTIDLRVPVGRLQLPVKIKLFIADC